MSVGGHADDDAQTCTAITIVTTLRTAHDSVLRPIAKCYFNRRAKLRTIPRFVKTKHAVNLTKMSRTPATVTEAEATR